MERLQAPPPTVGCTRQHPVCAAGTIVTILSMIVSLCRAVSCLKKFELQNRKGPSAITIELLALPQKLSISDAWMWCYKRSSMAALSGQWHAHGSWQSLMMQRALSLREAWMAERLPSRRQHAGATPSASSESRWHSCSSQVGTQSLMLDPVLAFTTQLSMVLRDLGFRRGVGVPASAQAANQGKPPAEGY